METKVCMCCGVEKPVSEFYKHKAMSDGYLGKCKGCQKANSMKNYHKNWEDRVSYEKTRNKDPDRKAKMLGYQRRSREDNPERYKANNAVNNAIRDGKLKREPCEKCGAAKAQAHHEDYSKPFDIEWLCRKCHVIHHGKKPY